MIATGSVKTVRAVVEKAADFIQFSKGAGPISPAGKLLATTCRPQNRTEQGSLMRLQACNLDFVMKMQGGRLQIVPAYNSAGSPNQATLQLLEQAGSSVHS